MREILIGIYKNQIFFPLLLSLSCVCLCILSALVIKYVGNLVFVILGGREEGKGIKIRGSVQVHNTNYF